MTKEEFIKALEPLGFELIYDGGMQELFNEVLQLEINCWGDFFTFYFDNEKYTNPYTQESLDKVIALYHSKNNMTREQFIEFLFSKNINCIFDYASFNDGYDTPLYDDYCVYKNIKGDFAKYIKYTLTNAYKLLAIKEAADKLNDLIENTKFEEVE